MTRDCDFLIVTTSLPNVHEIYSPNSRDFMQQKCHKQMKKIEIISYWSAEIFSCQASLVCFVEERRHFVESF